MYRLNYKRTLRVLRVRGFESHLGLRFFCVLLWLILYISLLFPL